MIDTEVNVGKLVAGLTWTIAAALLVAAWWVPFLGHAAIFAAIAAATLTVRHWFVRVANLVRVMAPLHETEPPSVTRVR